MKRNIQKPVNALGRIEKGYLPSMHWQHIRTTNPIESTFATVRHRSTQTKGCGSRQATLSMVYKLGTSAEKHWRKLRGHQLIEKVIQGIKFKDGEEVKEAAQNF